MGLWHTHAALYVRAVIMLAIIIRKCLVYKECLNMFMIVCMKSAHT